MYAIAGTISSVSEMVGHLGWESLAIRRNYMRLHDVQDYTCTFAGDTWQRWLMPSTRQTRGFHLWRYIPLIPSDDPYKFSFLPSTIPVRNNLPPHVVSSPTRSGLNSRTCKPLVSNRPTSSKPQGFLTSPFIFTAPFFFVYNLLFYFRGYISHAILHLRSDRCHPEKKKKAQEPC